jgi:hypothetical protein
LSSCPRASAVATLWDFSLPLFRVKYVAMTAAGVSFRTNDGWFQSMTRREAAWLAIGSLGFALVFSYPILGDLVYLGPGVSGWITAGPVFSHLARLPANGDWDAFTDLRWVAYQTIAQLPSIPVLESIQMRRVANAG